MEQDKFSDRGYKALFSHPKMVEDLLRSFVREDFLPHLDFSTLRRTGQTFVTEEFRERECDIVWELNIKGRPAYVYLLLEFQSTVDRFMALRMATYVLLFYKDLLNQGGIARLPPVFSIVLYNGDQRWTAPESLEELIEVPFPSIRRYIPRFRYYKIAENEFSAASLLELENLVSSVFLIESGDIDNIVEAITRVRRVYEREASPELKRDFSLWLGRLLEREGMGVDLTALEESEVNQMLETRFKLYREKLHLEGLLEGQRSALRVLLDAKFGEDARGLADRAESIVESAQLEALLRHTASATSLGEFQKLWPAG